MRHQGLQPIPRKEASRIVEEVVRGLEDVAEIFVAGSYRREKLMVGDLDFVVVPKIDLEEFWQKCREVLGDPLVGGNVRVKPRLKKKEIARKGQFIYQGIVAVDIYVAEKDLVEPFLLYLTGSAEFNRLTRFLAKQKGLVLSQYGLRDGEGRLVGEQTEKGILESLGLGYIEPKGRESYLVKRVYEEL